ncbi:MAG: hypothetical protein ABMA64_34565 [Myxococcota bacterium]
MSPLILLAACGWNRLPSSFEQSIDPLWDPSGALPTVDGLYVPLTASGQLALISPEGEYDRIDVGEGRVTRIARAPDNRTVLAFVERYWCDTDDAREARRVDTLTDCDGEDLVVETELSLVAGGAVGDAQSVSGAYNRVAFSDDGKHAIAFLDLSDGIDVDSVLNLTAVMVVDLDGGTSELVPVGFAADEVLFVEDEVGQAIRAVVVSRNQVGVIDLASSPAALTVTFPLTLDPDVVVDPVGIALTPSGDHALVSARGSSDLYALDLEVQAINIVELASAPAAMAVAEAADRTVLVYGGAATVQLLDHEVFELETFPLDEPMSRITVAGDQALLWDDTTAHDLYRVDLGSDDVIEYRLQNPAVSLHVAPTAEFAVALTRAEGGGGTGVDALYDTHPGMEVIDLRTDETEPFLLVGDGLGVAFAADETHLNALVLQRGVESLFRLDLYTQQTEEIELSAPPVAIGTLADGRFFITHTSALGLVTFLDPATGKTVEVAGFAAQALFDPIDLQQEAP